MASYKPTDGMKSEARKGLDWRSEFGRGGTEVGIARARDIVNDRELSEDTVKRMYSFFSRHEVDKKAEGFRPGEDGYPSNGRIAWALWGGDAGYSWAKDKVSGMERSYEDGRPFPNEHAARLHDPDKYVSFRRDNNAGGSGVDFIYGILDGGGTELQAIRFDKNRFTPAEAKAWLSKHDFKAILFEEATGERDMEDLEERAKVKVEIEIDTSDAPEQPEVDPVEEAVAAVVADAAGVDPNRFAADELAHRSIGMDAKVIDENTRTVTIAVSSELPVARSYGNEILVHEPEAIDMAFVASGRAPLLLDHDMEKQIGVIESVELSGDRKLRAKVRFSRSALGQEVFQDVVDGIRSNISVGYRVNKMERSNTNKEDYLVRAWSPMEVSVVSIPADPSVGVGRSAAATEPQPNLIVEPQIRKEDKMSDIDLEAVKAEAAKAAARNAADIVALGAKHNKRDLAEAAIGAGKTIDQFRGELLEVLGNVPLESKDVGLTTEERKSFSLVRAIHALANPTDYRAQEAARFEFEASRAAAQAYGVTAQGLMIPAEVLGNWKRDLSVGTNSAGGYTVATDLLASEFIDVLRNASSVMQAGARMMPGLVGNIAIPKKTAASTAGWISTEGGAASEVAPTFGQVTLSPKTLGAFSDVTRKLLLQSSLSIESLIRDDLTNAIALKIDSGALEGDGSSGAPTGVLSTSGVNKPSSFAAAVPTFAEVVALETYVAQDNALLGNLAYITDTGTFGGLKTTKKDAGSGEFVAGPDGRLNGYNTIVSNQVTAGNVYFGNWADLMIGMWGGLDITVDPYTASTTGTVRIVALQSVDVAVRHAESFAYNNDGV